MVVVEPRVSTDSRFLTSTFFLAILCEVRVRATVTVSGNPSGTLATMIPMVLTITVTIPCPRASPNTRKTAPIPRANAVMTQTKYSISILRGVFSFPVDEANFAMFPMTVLSPVRTMTPIPLPLAMNEPKKTRFAVSRGLAWEDSGARVWGSDSPVSDELFTLRSLHERILTSAGTLSPDLTRMMSPGTQYFASRVICWPSLRSTALTGTMFLKPSMIFELFASWK
mmetsp:Transcript_4534/g.17159  ORF Transcript_4534/g.17159 Transcript_4534/m.17159 type:complete len:226 (-) Transcript_4534:691-1368(-)